MPTFHFLTLETNPPTPTPRPKNSAMLNDGENKLEAMFDASLHDKLAGGAVKPHAVREEGGEGLSTNNLNIHRSTHGSLKFSPVSLESAPGDPTLSTV